MNLDNAVVYDEECLPNVWTLTAEMLHSTALSTWEISEYRDDRRQLFQWLGWLQSTQTAMIGFFSLKYDYPLLHFIHNHPNVTYADIYAKSQELIKNRDGFANMIWDRDRLAPQIDLAAVHHFDNKAKTTSLKALEINMRSQTVRESRLPWNKPATREEIDSELIPYNIHDVKETKQFAFHSMSALDFRLGLIPQFGVDVLNYPDTKIGEKMLEQRLGDEVCYTREPFIDKWGNERTRKQKRQTPRNRIALNDIIFPYVRFTNPEFQRCLDFLRAQVLTPDDIDDPDATIKTKGVLSGLTAHVGGIDFEFGTGGIHASVLKKRFAAGDGWIIRDIDVASLYPSLAIANKLSPEHLGDAFITEYAKLPAERKEWQKKKGKKCVEANSIKLAGNGAYGKTNSKFSFLYDPKYTMTVTINGQLLLCMLAEWLLTVPTISLIQCNTDGITFMIHESQLEACKAVEKQWEAFTCLTLEDVHYNRMFIHDVNTYLVEPVAEPGSNEPVQYKQKGRLWHPDPFNYAQSISECQPPAWHKDLGNVVSIRAAIAAMLYGVDPENYIRFHTEPHDFMMRYRARGEDRLELGGVPVQSTFRYYVARNGAPLVKTSPAKGPIGAYKMARGVSEAAYNARMAETGGEHCPTVCTKNKSKYDQVNSAIEAGWNVADACDMSGFSYANVDYRYYVAEARKLIVD